MTQKEFIQPSDLMRDSFALARMVYDSGFRPDALLALWRGGTPIGVAVHEYLQFKGIHTLHAVVKVESYTGIGTHAEPRIHFIEPILAAIPAKGKVLIVDDIYDSGRTLRKLRDILAPRTTDIRVATLFLKAGATPDSRPDYFVHETDRWIVFPHELMDLTPDEIQAKGDYIRPIL